MHRVLISCLATLTVAVTLTAVATPASAVPCLPPTWYASAAPEPVEALDGGRLVVFASIQTTFDSVDPGQHLDTITVTVARPDGSEPVAGTLAWDAVLEAVVWTPDAPLAADGSTWRATFVFDSMQLEGNCGPGFGMTTVAFDFTVRDATPDAVAPDPAVAGLTETRRSVEDCCATSAPELCYPNPSPCQTCWPIDYRYTPTLAITWTAAQDPALEPWTAYRVERVEPDGTTVEIGTWPAPDAGQILVAFEQEAARYCARVVTLDRLAGTELASTEVCADAADLEPIARDTPPPPPTDRCDGAGEDVGEDVAEGTDTSDSDTTSGGDTAVGADDDAQPVSADEGCSCRVRTTPAAPLGHWPWAAVLVGLAFGVARRRRR